MLVNFCLCLPGKKWKVLHIVMISSKKKVGFKFRVSLNIAI